MQAQKSKLLSCALVVAVLLLASLLPAYQDTIALLVAIDRVGGFSQPAIALEPTVPLHPLSGSVEGKLPWEDNQSFRALRDKYQADTRMAAYKIAITNMRTGEDHNFAHAAKLLAGTVLQPGEAFSMNNKLGPYTMSRGYQEGPVYVGAKQLWGVGGGVCKLATALFNAAVLADLPIEQRRPHSMLVPYVNPGQDAAVAYGKLDLRFRNNTEAPILVWAGTEDTTLYVGFYGKRQPPKVTWHHELLFVQDRYTIWRINEELAPGEEKVLTPGADGLTVKSWVDIEYPDGTIKVKHMGVYWYRPMTRVVEYGPVR